MTNVRLTFTDSLSVKRKIIQIADKSGEVLLQLSVSMTHFLDLVVQLLYCLYFLWGIFIN